MTRVFSAIVLGASFTLLLMAIFLFDFKSIISIFKYFRVVGYCIVLTLIGIGLAILAKVK